MAPHHTAQTMTTEANPNAALGLTPAADAPAQPRLQEGFPGARLALRVHWPEYLMEAAELGAFMVSACLFTALFEYPGSPVRQALASAALRRALTGLAMGLTAIAIIYSPWGKQSGAHFNPAATLTFFRLGKIAGWDALFYMAAQFAGAALGVAASAALLGRVIADPSVGFAVTAIGPAGTFAAFAAETFMAALLMTVVLRLAGHERLGRYTGMVAGALVALYIAVEAPISGMSINPARTFGSAVWARTWQGFWLYLIAPPIGMLAASQLHLWWRGHASVPCAKFHHFNDKRCIHCRAAGANAL